MTGTVELWAIIIALGAGSFSLRFAFLWFVGDRKSPECVLLHLRDTAVSILNEGKVVTILRQYADHLQRREIKPLKKLLYMIISSLW